MVTQYTHNILSDLQMFFHQAGSCQMEGITALYNYIMSFLTGILCVVTTALVIIIFFHIHGRRHIYQYKVEKNLDLLIEWLKYVQKWTHSTTLELVWTIIPTTILIAIAIPSFILLYSLDEIVDTQTVIKVTAFQWYWKYEYPVISPYSEDTVNFSYLSYMLPTEDLTEENSLRLLEVDMPLVVPINVNVKFIITSKDVIHSFAVPALGVKMDAVPGRLNQVTVHIYKPGIYFGQCSELCGVNHAFMPIALHAVDFNTFESFLLRGVDFTEVNDGQTMEEFKKMLERVIELDPSVFDLLTGTGIFAEETKVEVESPVEVEDNQDTVANDELESKDILAVSPSPEDEPKDNNEKNDDANDDDKYDIRHIPDERIQEYLNAIKYTEEHPEQWEKFCKQMECVIDPETGKKICKPKTLTLQQYHDFIEYTCTYEDTQMELEDYYTYLKEIEKNNSTMTFREYEESLKTKQANQVIDSTASEEKKNA